MIIAPYISWNEIDSLSNGDKVECNALQMLVVFLLQLLGGCVVEVGWNIGYVSRDQDNVNALLFILQPFLQPANVVVGTVNVRNMHWIIQV